MKSHLQRVRWNHDKQRHSHFNLNTGNTLNLLDSLGDQLKRKT